MIRLLAVDMDGTCLNRKNQIIEQNMAALRRLVQSGIQIVPASGRASTCLPHQLRAAPMLFRYAITSNGARVDDVRGHCLFCQEIFPIPPCPCSTTARRCASASAPISAEHTSCRAVCCR